MVDRHRARGHGWPGEGDASPADRVALDTRRPSRSGRLRLALAFLIALAGYPAAGPVTCLPAPYRVAEDETGTRAEIAALARWLEPTLAEAPSLSGAFAALLPDLCLSPRVEGADGYLDVETRRIVLDARASAGLQRGILLHELRHLDQFHRGYCPANVLTLRENARATFAIEADASAISLLLAWQRRAQGDAMAWEALAASPQQADIAGVLAEAIEAGVDLPDAAAAAFARWYGEGTRRETYYAASCGDYLDREERGRLQRGRAVLPPDFFTWLCVLPDGRQYPCAEPTDGWR